MAKKSSKKKATRKRKTRKKVTGGKKTASRKKTAARKKTAKKKNKKTVKKRTAAGPVKICFERILPDEIDPERIVRRRMRETIIESADGPMDATAISHVKRMAVVNTKKWSAGTVLNCRFLDGSKTMRKKVEAVAHEWEQYTSLKFKFVKSGPAEIRISFYADAGSWSAVGRDALNTQYFPLHQPTMNFGWLRDKTSNREYSRVVLHEFGHAIGCIHEHQQPKFTRKWNPAAVMQYFQGPPNFWGPKDIKHNVLNKYSSKGITATRYDPKSIMLYDFDGRLFSDGLGPTNSNSRLSALDQKLIKQMYP